MPQEPDDREYTPDESRLKTSFRECIPLFIALGDSTRLAIIQQLYEVEDRRSSETEQKGGRSVSEKRRAPGLNVKEITEKTSLSRPAVSHHLKILKDSGLIAVEKRGVCNYYHLTSQSAIDRLLRLNEALQQNSSK
ncbi:MAG: ArsR/SmtB family transcription factor [Lachnospiraceae bacterium]|jgi:transcriptional regulator, arsR family